MSNRARKFVNPDAKIMFSLPFRLGSLSPFNAASDKLECGVAHRNPFVACVKNVVYSIPLTCGKVYYVGETSQCLNQRLLQHLGNVNKRLGLLQKTHLCPKYNYS